MDTESLMSIARQNGLYFSFVGAKPRQVNSMSDDELKNAFLKWHRVMDMHNKEFAKSMIAIIKGEIERRKHAKKEPAGI
jgi:alkylated DNA nucleotide flippase Atl1